MINTQDAANLTNYNLTDFYIKDINENVNKSEAETDSEPVNENKYLLCKRKTTVDELDRTPTAPEYCRTMWNLTKETTTSPPKSSPTIFHKGGTKDNFNDTISKLLRVRPRWPCS